MTWIMFTTTSLDGRIATIEGDSKLSCDYDLQLLHKFRCWSDLVLVGANTAIADDPGLFIKRVKCGRQPYRGVIDGKLRIPINLRLFQDQPWLSIVVTTTYGIRSNPTKYKFLTNRGVKVVIVGNGPSIDMKEARVRLEEMGIRRVLIEGGGKLNWSLIKDDVVDRLEITYVGRVLGAGVPIIDGEGFKKVLEAPVFIPIDVRRCKCGKCVHVSWVRSTMKE